MQARRPLPRALGLALLVALVVAGPTAQRAEAASDLQAQGPDSPDRLVVTAWQFTFTPAYPAVAVGTTVTWVNRDREAHTVTSDVGLFDAEIGPGERFSVTFDEPGAYFFYCQPHDWMIGEITVAPAEYVRATAVPASAEGAAGQSADIAMLGYEFQPASIAIHAGGAVTWTNYDAEQHTATATDQVSWTTSVLSGGRSESVQFAEPGTYLYACSIHPSMLGEIIVLLPD